MGLLNDLKTKLEQEMPARLREPLQGALDNCRAECNACGLLMHRHHRYLRSIMTGCGEVRLEIPYFAGASATL